MAAGAANITSIINDDTTSTAGRPSVFEIVSQQGFAHALRPAFSHIVKTLAERYPEGFVSVVFRNFDEIYLGFDALVQWHYILTRGSTLAEAFYGLERTLLSNNKRLLRIRLSYILTVVLPYLQNKLEKSIANNENVSNSVPSRDDHNSSTDSSPPQPPPTKIRHRLFNFILKYYPFIKTLAAIINFGYLLRFSFGYTDYHSLIFRMLNMNLVYASPSRTKFVEEKKSEIFRADSWNLKRIPVLVMRSLGESILFGVEMGSFFVQFLDWWYNDPRSERVALTSLPVPPPLSSGDQNFLQIKESEKDKCPLCRKKIRNPSALATSGVVYCYSCIVPYLKTDGKCPLTSLKSSVEHLIRIYS